MAEFYAAVTTDAGLALSADLLVGEQIVLRSWLREAAFMMSRK